MNNPAGSADVPGEERSVSAVLFGLEGPAYAMGIAKRPTNKHKRRVKADFQGFSLTFLMRDRRSDLGF